MATKPRWLYFLLILIVLSTVCSAGWFFIYSLRLPKSESPPTSPGVRNVNTNPTRWPKNSFDWQTSPVDLSFLNAKERPAGRRGFVKVAGESLIFEDGSPAFFWGINIAASALFGTSKQNVKLQAKRISALGFNLVRIHHHDSPWVNPNIFGKDATNTQTLDAAALDRLDWWIKCLKDEGIYIWLDLHVQRAFTEGDDIYAFDEMPKNDGKADLKGYCYVNQSIMQAIKQFNELYLNHINSFTGIAYKNEPAIMALLITNENDITHHFGNALLPDKKVPLHSNLYMRLAKEFANKNGLPADKTWRSWEPGTSKLFANDLEHRFDSDMINHLHALGVRVPIVTTSAWGDDHLYSLPALTTGDIIDVHAYGGAFELDNNPLSNSNMVNWLSMWQVSGKPMSISEWNVSPFPVPDRHSSPLYIASAGRLQGWDAIMLFAYSEVPMNDADKVSNWISFNDPALISTLPAAALLYRQHHVKESDSIYAIIPDREQLFFQANSADNSIAARTASEKGKLVLVMPEILELPWLKKGTMPPDAKVIRNMNQTYIDKEASEVFSDSGEIHRNWTEGIYTIETPLTQAAMGWIGGRSIVLPDATFDIKTSNASIVVQSLDGAPINRSANLMISLGAHAVPGGDEMRFRSEPVLGQLTIKAAKGLKLHKKSFHQQDMELPVIYSDGSYIVSLDATLETSWLFLR